MEHLAIAGIHATVISFAIAGATIYLSRMLQSEDELSHQIFESAEKINHIPAPSWFHLPGDIDYNDREGILERIHNLCNPSAPREYVEGTEAELLPEISADRAGVKLAEALSVLVSMFPFPTMLYPRENGLGISNRPTPVSFTTITDVRDWVGILDRTTEDALGSLRWGDQQIQTRIREGDVLHRQELSEMLGDISAPSGGEINPSGQVIDCFHQSVRLLDNAQDIVKSVRDPLRRYDALLSRHPSRLTLVIAGFGLFAAFWAGVIIPLVDPRPPRWLIVRVPITVYAAGIASFFWWATRPRTPP